MAQLLLLHEPRAFVRPARRRGRALLLARRVSKERSTRRSPGPHAGTTVSDGDLRARNGRGARRLSHLGAIRAPGRESSFAPQGRGGRTCLTPEILEPIR